MLRRMLPWPRSRSSLLLCALGCVGVVPGCVDRALPIPAAPPDLAPPAKCAVHFERTAWIRRPENWAFIAVADFDGDSRQDVATVSLEYPYDGYPVTISIAPQKASGEFWSPSVVDTSSQAPPMGVTAADFDGDGRSDLALALAERIEIWRGRSDGAIELAAAHDAPLGTRFEHIDSAPLDRDQGPSAIVLAKGETTHSLEVLLFAPDGSVSSAVTTPVAATANYLALGDFDGDGKIDAVVAGGGQVQVWRGMGDGTFGAGAVLADSRWKDNDVGPEVGVVYQRVDVGDLDGDGLSDVLVPPGATKDSGAVLYGRADGSLQRGPFPGPADAQESRIVGDLDGNQTIDLMSWGPGDTHGVRDWYWTHRADGVWTTEGVRSDQRCAKTMHSRIIDDRDEVLCVEQSSFTVRRYRLAADGMLQSSAIGFGLTPGSVAIADLDRDGALDALVGGDSGVYLFRGSGDGRVADPRALDSSGVGALSRNVEEVADLDGDGLLDVLVSSGAKFYLLRGHGDGTFDPPELTGAPKTNVPPPIFDGAGTLIPANEAIAADFNEDGVLDYAFVMSNGDAKHNRVLGVALAQGDPSKPMLSATFLPAQDYVTFGITDLDNDGHFDLVAVSYDFENGIASVASAALSTLRGHGDGSFAAPVRSAIENTPDVLFFADIDRDGAIDVATGGLLQRGLVWFRGNGDGSMAAQPPMAGDRYSRFASGDFDGDGWPDLLALSWDQFSVSLLVNRQMCQ